MLIQKLGIYLPSFFSSHSKRWLIALNAGIFEVLRHFKILIKSSKFQKKSFDERFSAPQFFRRNFNRDFRQRIVNGSLHIAQRAL